MTDKRSAQRVTKEHWLLIYGVVGLGFLAAQALVGTFGLSYLLVFMTSSGLVGLGVFGLLRLLRKGALADQTRKQVKRIEREVHSLSVQEAKRVVRALLVDPQKFHCEAGGSAKSEALGQLAPSLRELFQQYETIETTRGEVKLNRQVLGPSNIKHGYLKIGSNAEFVEVAVKAGEEAVYELDDTVPKHCEPQESDIFPTIYHYLLVEAKLLFE